MTTVVPVVRSDALAASPAASEALLAPLLAAPRVIAVSSPDASWRVAGPAARVIAVPYGQSVTVAIEGASAAYSLDAGVARAGVSGNVVTVVARNTGSTHVVVTRGRMVEYLRVLVGDPPVTRLPGFTAAGVPEQQAGSADLQYSTNLGLLQSGVRLMRRDGARSVELAVSAAAAVSSRDLPPVSLPLASLSFKNGRRHVTLMDRVVDNSPLTMVRSNVRGVHWEEGPVRVHGGYSFFGTFEHLLIPADRQAVAGLSYQQRLGRTTTVTPNLYYYRSRASGPGDGLAATAVLETQPFEGAQALAEVAVGGGTGGVALDLQVARPDVQAWATLRVAPDALPTLRTDQPAGRQIDAGVVKSTERWRVDARALSQQFGEGANDQSTHVLRVDLSRTLARWWQVHGGSFFSTFDGGASHAKVQSVGVPAGVAVNAGPVGAGLDYQWSRETGQRVGGHLLRASLNGTRGRLYIGGSAERQTQAPTLSAAFFDQPALQRELDRLGIAASTPEQLAEVLRTNASLAALGYASAIGVDLTPVRDRLTGRLTWTAPGRFRPRLDIGSTMNRDARVTRTRRSSVHSASATAHVRSGTDAALTWSLVCPDRPSGTSRCQPALMASLQQQLGRMAGLLGGPRAGEVSGVVFRDDQGRGSYVPGMPGLAGYEVILDGAHRSFTVGDGRYVFHDVRPGPHRVEVQLPAGGSVYFTTPSPVDVRPGRPADFGIALTQSRLRARARTDVDQPLVGVVLHATDGMRTLTATTDADGVAPFVGLAEGTYHVHVDPGSLPVGYYLPDPAARPARVMPRLSDMLTFTVHAARSIAGHVRRFDRTLGTYVPAASVPVALHPTNQRSTTDRQGRYVFRGLSAGTYTVAAGAGGRARSAVVTLPVGPAALSGIDLQIVSDEAAPAVVATSAPTP